eukprot:4788299-Amphidinium_carterae.1
MTAALTTPPDRLVFSSFSPDVQQRAKKLYSMLCTSVRGKALLRVRAAEKGNGLDAWVKLKREYEPQLGSRRMGMLIGILNPTWSDSKKDFAELLAEWEEGVLRYEREITGQLAEDIKIATVVRNAPEPLRGVLRAASHQFGNSYVQLKMLIEHYTQAGHDYDATGVRMARGAASSSSDPTPMDVGALWAAKLAAKGKGKGKDKKGGKGKPAQPPHQGNKGAGKKGEGKGKDKKEGKAAPFQGYCDYCGRWGHKKADCWKKQAKVVAVEESGGAGASSSGGPSAGETGSAPVASIAAVSPIFIMAVSNTAHKGSAGSTVEIVADSGSGEHCCPEWFAPHIATEPCQVMLRDVQGRRIGDKGQKMVPLKLGNGRDIAITFVVSAVCYPVISLGKLRKQGFGVEFKANAEEGNIRHASGLKIPLLVKGDQWMVRAKIMCEHELEKREGISISALEQEDAWMYPEEEAEMNVSSEWQKVPMEYRAAIHGGEGLPPEGPPEVLLHEGAAEEIEAPMRFNATRDQMRARLRRYGVSASGTKAELWARLTQIEFRRRREKRQAELMAERAEDLRHGRAEYAPVLLPAPETPTEEEREHHNLTHIPPKRWCEFCVQGRACDDPHWRTGNTASRAVPVVQMDFMFMDALLVPVEKRDQAAYITLVGYDAASGYPLAVAVTSKTPSRYLAASMAHFIQRLHGHQEVTVRTDGEPAITKLAENVVSMRAQNTGVKVKTNIEGVSRYSSSSKGGVENACKLMQGVIRSLRFSLEARYGAVITPEKPIWPFLVHHAAFIAARFHIKPSGVTPFKAAFGEDYHEQLIEMGETIMARQPVSPSGKIHGNRRYRKADTLWLKGIWLGRTEQTAEHIVAVIDHGLPEGERAGVITVRTVRRLEKEKQSDKSLLAGMQGAPWQAFGLARSNRRKRVHLGPDAVIMREMMKPEGGGSSSVGVADDRANYEETSVEAARQSELETNLPPSLLVERGESGETIGEALQGVPATPGTPATPATPSQVPATATPAERAKDTAATIPRTPAVNPDAMEDIQPRGMKREASDQLQPAGNDVLDIGAVLVEREVNGRRVHLTDSPETNYKDVEIEDMPELDIEQLLKKNAEEVEPNWETAEADIKDEKMAELQVFWDWNAFELVPRAQVKPEKTVDVKWIVEWRGKAGWRTRCVAREYRWLEQRDDIFAPTTSGATARVIDAVAIKRGWHTFTADATKAYLQVDEPEEVYVVPPEEFQEMLLAKGLDPSLCWRMKKILNGRRTGAVRWVTWASERLKELDFDAFTAAPYLFKHRTRGIIMELHMDDYYGTATCEDAEWLKKALSEKVQLKGFEIHGLSAQYSHLKRERERLPSSMKIKPNPKYVASVLRLLGLDDCKAVNTPCVERGRATNEEDDEEELSSVEQGIYRQAMGVLNYFAHERLDVQYAVRMLGQHLVSAKQKHMRALKRLGRYLRGTADYQLQINKSQLRENVIKVEGDADWAGDPESRRSVTAGTLYWDKVPMSSWSRLQSVRALSSGESEYYQLTTAGAEAMFMKSVLDFIGEECRIELYTDSSAALGISQCAGTGKVRHLDLRLLWVQDGLKEGLFCIMKINSAQNTGDLGTKPLGAMVINKHLRAMGYNGKMLSGSKDEPKQNRKVASLAKQYLQAAVGMALARGAKGEVSITMTVNEKENSQVQGALQMKEGMNISIMIFTLLIVVMMWSIIKVLWHKVSPQPMKAEAMTQTMPANEPEQYHLLRVDQLRERCKSKRLSINGFKDQLISRLYRDDYEGLG